MTRDFVMRCHVMRRCRNNALYGVQGPGYGVGACEDHRAKAHAEAQKAARAELGEKIPDGTVKEWRLAYFDDAKTIEQLTLPLENT